MPEPHRSVPGWFNGALRRLARRPAPRLSKVADTKASRVGPLLAFEALGQPVWSPRDYAAFAREGFAQNAVVYRSVRMIAFEEKL